MCIVAVLRRCIAPDGRTESDCAIAFGLVRGALLTSVARFVRSRGSLADLYSGRDNGIGMIRLLLAIAVVVSHSGPLGFATEDLGAGLFGHQATLGLLAVYGFFVLSGLLITRSARRTPIGRYAWHRSLRILPGFWVCLLVTALLVAPLITLRERGSLQGFWSGPYGPFGYFTENMWTGIRQPGINDVFATTPWGRKAGGVSVLDGALWSLCYEMLCYIAVGVLAATGVLRNSRRFVLFLTLALYVNIVQDYWRSGALSGPASGPYGQFGWPMLGALYYQWIVYLGFLFLCGATIDLYRERIPINDALGVASAVAFVASLLFGGLFVVGFPAFAYLLVWLAVRMPRWLQWIGRRHDYSYGIYIYGFLMQQVLSSFGLYRWGLLPYVVISVAGAFVCAYLSWHLVERHALALKGWTPRLRQRRPAERDSEAEPQVVPVQLVHVRMHDQAGEDTELAEAGQTAAVP